MEFTLFIDLQLFTLRQSERHHPPILGQMLHSLETGDQLQTHKALLVPLDVFQQEGVFDYVLVAKVEFDLKEEK